MDKFGVKSPGLAMIVVLMALLLGTFSTYQYYSELGLEYLEEGKQIIRQQKVMEGHAGNPWQYRILGAYLNNIVIDFFNRLPIRHPIAVSFIAVRVVQDTLILLLAFIYYRKLGLHFAHALIGIAVLTWGMSYSHYDSDFAFNTFYEVFFYLMAGISILFEKYIWIIPITFIAALNRETSGLIPFLLLISAIFGFQAEKRRPIMPIFTAAIGIYIAIFFGLRLVYGKQELLLPYGHRIGLDLLQYNLSRGTTWLNLVATLSIIPIIALMGYGRWPVQLRCFFLGNCPNLVCCACFLRRNGGNQAFPGTPSHGIYPRSVSCSS